MAETTTTTTTTYREGIIDAYAGVLRDIDESFIMGEDIRVASSNTTVGLVDEFGPDRVRDTPISEQGFVGMGVGAAMDGKRPIIELTVNTLPFLVADQVINHAQKIHYMSGGKSTVPLTIVIPTSGGAGGGGHHSDHAYPVYLNYGVKTVVPSTPADVKGLFRSAVLEDDLVVVYYPKALHETEGKSPADGYQTPLGKADRKREGTDVTIVAIGEMVPQALSVAEQLAPGISVEVVDPRTLIPLDEQAILDSVKKTGRLIVAEGGQRICGIGAEIAAIVANKSFSDLDSPIKRVTRANVPIPKNIREVEGIEPNEEILTQAVHDIV